MSVFFTSDLHIGHENICNNLRNDNAENNKKLIIQNWNNLVYKNDIVYILGDLVMEKPKNLDFLNELNGNIRVIGGNHDNRKVCMKLQEMNIPVLGVLNYKGFLCTHIPIHPMMLIDCRGNIHGHIHNGGTNYCDLQNKKYFNVNCEFHNYKPVNFEQILNYFNYLSLNKDYEIR